MMIYICAAHGWASAAGICPHRSHRPLILPGPVTWTVCEVGTENGPNPAVSDPENQHCTAPAKCRDVTETAASKVPSQYQNPHQESPQVSNITEASPGVVGSNPAAPTPHNPAPPADLAPHQSGPPPKNTTSVPTPAPSLGAGSPLCGNCLEADGDLFGSLSLSPGLRAQMCVRCGQSTWKVFTPQVGAGGTVAYEAPTLEHIGNVPARRALDVCTCGRPRSEHLESGTMRADSRACDKWMPVPSADALAAIKGPPFGVEFTNADGYHAVQVRDAHGLVAYVSVGLETEDAARWAALSWLRGQARDVAAGDAEALRDAFKNQSLRIDPPAGPPPAVLEVDGDPLRALMEVRGVSETLRDRLLAWLKRREVAWDDLADREDLEPVSVATAKEHADTELAAVFAAMGGAS